MKTMIFFAVLSGLVYVCILGGIVYVAIHFIAKVW